MVLTFMYQSVLINKLTVTQFDRPVDSLAQILHQGLTPLIFYRSSNIKEWKASEETVFRKIGDRLQGYTSDSEALHRLLSEDGFAMLSTQNLVEYEIYKKKIPGATYMSREPFQKNMFYSSWMFGRGFPLGSNISRLLQRSFETGIYRKVSRLVSLNKACYASDRVQMDIIQSQIQTRPSSSPCSRLVLPLLCLSPM